MNNAPANQTIKLIALQYPPDYKKWRRIGAVGIGLVSVGILLFVVAGMSQATPQAGTANTLGALGLLLASIFFPLGLLACIIGYGWSEYKENKAYEQAYQQFLADNGWLPTAANSLEHVATSVVGAGSEREVTREFVGKYKGLQVYGLTYQFVTGSGKSRETHYTSGLYFGLTQQYPLIVLDDRLNDSWIISNLPNRIPEGRDLQVEGDFDNRYRLTVLPGTERTALQLLTPDFMQELMANPQVADIEIEADKLFVVCNSPKLTAESLQCLFLTADVVLKHLTELSDSWQASSSRETVTAIGTESLKPRAQALRSPKTTAGLVVLAVILLLLSQPLSILAAFSPAIMRLYMGAVLVFLVATGFYYYKRFIK